MSLDSAVDSQAAALALLGYTAINYDLASTVGDSKAVKALTTVPLLNRQGATIFGEQQRPVFSAWRASENYRRTTMHEEVDEVLWYFDYLAPSPSHGRYEERRALLRHAWVALRSAIRAGEHTAYLDGNGDPIQLTDLGFGNFDLESLKVRYSDAPEIDWFRGQVTWEWCEPEDLSAYPDLVEAYFNISLRPTVQDPANDPLVIARATP